MWRRNKGLDYWLNQTANPADAVPEEQGKKRLHGKVRPWNLKSKVRNCPVDVPIRIADPENMLYVPAKIEDGLGTFFSELVGTNQGGFENIQSAISIHWADLMEPAPVRPLELPDGHNVQVKQALLTFIPYCRRFKVDIDPIPVRSPDTVQLRLPKTAGRSALLPEDLMIRSMMPQASDLQVRQRSVDMESLTDLEKREFLQETELLKGFAADQCELLAVFRHVPVEMISKLSFINDDKTIVYSLSRGLERSTTRVYDLMVIRNNSREIHLIPHGKRSRSVGLN